MEEVLWVRQRPSFVPRHRNYRQGSIGPNTVSSIGGTRTRSSSSMTPTSSSRRLFRSATIALCIWYIATSPPHIGHGLRKRQAGGERHAGGGWRFDRRQQAAYVNRHDGFNFDLRVLACAVWLKMAVLPRTSVDGGGPKTGKSR